VSEGHYINVAGRATSNHLAVLGEATVDYLEASRNASSPKGGAITEETSK
jgi:hypothetical protein